jgi:hypothetical protein
VQSRLYEVNENDIKELSKSANFDGVGGTADSSNYMNNVTMDEPIIGLDI